MQARWRLLMAAGDLKQGKGATKKSAIIGDANIQEADTSHNGNSVLTGTTKAGLTGTVVAVQANYYWVRLDKVPTAESPRRLLCTRRARLKKVGQRVAVGDRVTVEEPDWQGQRGAIAQVSPRRSYLDRPPIANVDRILLVFSLAEPALDFNQLSRFLIKAESTGVDICLCLNKRDLVSDSFLNSVLESLDRWGYQPIVTSVVEDPTLEELRSPLAGVTTVVAGPSGVGKSSTINALIPTAQLRVNAVSGKLARGRHTTRHVELFELPGGGLLADTPGFNQPTLSCTPEALAGYFPEIRRRLRQDKCRYGDCRHRDEPECAMGDDWERYDLYLELLEEAEIFEEQQRQQVEEDPKFKRKVTRDGQEVYEPRLASQRYRRQSRRSQHQTLEDLVWDQEQAELEPDELDGEFATDLEEPPWHSDADQ
ncbi:MAG: small ribosomal subunit biogenesis GTPase RsgA [Cyanobacteria bacterium P01_F01_bin.153]